MNGNEIYILKTQRITKVIMASAFLVFAIACLFFSTQTSFATPPNLLETTSSGKYTVAMSSTTISGKVQAHFVILNTETGESKIHQLFYDTYGNGWKTIELSTSTLGLGMPKADF